ncbi:MAG: hypothetical protein CME31_17005 [Gimesia sp.]|jgi:hypothetical protein|uniref:Uncharacterized protein n=1 Tax=Gimesia maris TaxID=122 RepID=A0A3D3R7W6_9PLAN|nr:hypothetical protein [Gimesia sp.]HCO24198.1 hypothetical protein [Gimesia maris]|tara:strand:+ start:53990 stop:54526 length:537 start_codon:yes stop_codon:yes gene_type:complete
MNQKIKFAFDPYNLRESVLPFRGIYDLKKMLELLDEYYCTPNVLFNLLPQCITKANCAQKIAYLQQKADPDTFSFIVTNSRRLDLDEVGYLNSGDWYAHVVIDGKLDPRFLEGIKVLRSFFSDKKWDSFDFVGDRPIRPFDDSMYKKKYQHLLNKDEFKKNCQEHFPDEEEQNRGSKR